MLDTDIDSLDYGTAREYVLAFLTTLQQTQRERAIGEEELAHWQRRVKLAENRGEPQLKKLAAQKTGELREKTARLAEEEQVLRSKVGALRQKLFALREKASFAGDADALLVQLRLLAGKPGALDQTVKELEALTALEALKRKKG